MAQSVHFIKAKSQLQKSDIPLRILKMAAHSISQLAFIKPFFPTTLALSHFIFNLDTIIISTLHIREPRCVTAVYQG